MSITRVILDEQDTDRLLRTLYHGERPEKVHTLICACSARADLRVSPQAWNGWQVLPFARCPTCLQKPRDESADADGYDEQIRDRFLAQLREILGVEG